MRDELRADAASTIQRFVEAGVAVKIISGDDPGHRGQPRAAGRPDRRPAVRSPAATSTSSTTNASAASPSETTIFGRITPAQKERLVDALRRRGHYVAMIGDGVNDVLSLKKANLAIAMGSGSQATRGVADLVLMEDTFGAVAQAVEEGQRIVNGMQHILKLFLTRIATVGLVVIELAGRADDPDRAAQRLRAHDLHRRGAEHPAGRSGRHPGRAHEDLLARTLARFVVPAAIVSSLLGPVRVLRLARTHRAPRCRRARGGRPGSAQAFTTFLVFAGLFLVVFVQPPIEWLAVMEPRTNDRRPTILARSWRRATSQPSSCQRRGTSSRCPCPARARRPSSRSRPWSGYR